MGQGCHSHRISLIFPMRYIIAIGAFLFLHLLVHGQDNAGLVQVVEKGDLASARHYLQGTGLANSFRQDYVPLIAIALQNKDQAMAQLLIDHGAQLYSWTGAGSPLNFCGDSTICDWFRSYRWAATVMCKATIAGNIDAVNAQAAKGFSVDLADSLHGRPLFIAADLGNLDMVQELLRLGAKPSVAWEENKRFSPLHKAADRGHLAIAKLLIERGADVNAKFANGCMPLHSALSSHHPDLAILLIENGANLEAPLHTGGYPLCLAAMFREQEVLNLLIEKGAQKPSSPEDQEILLGGLANFGDVALFKHYVAQLGLDAQLPLRERMTHDYNPLVTAAAHDSLALVQYLVEDLHYNVNRISSGASPLSMACRKGHLEVARYLIDHGADVDAPVQSSNAIGHAIMDCRPAIVELLLQKGAHIGTVHTLNHPLQLACTFNCLAGAKLLLKYGANAADGECSPIQGKETKRYLETAQSRFMGVFHAMENKDYASVEAFLKASGNPNTSNDGYSLLEIAVEAGDLAGMQLMLRYGADPNFAPMGGQLPLIAAINAPNPKTMITALIAKGAKVNPVSPKGWTPLAWAAYEGTPEAVQTLLEAGADPNYIGIDGRPDWFSACREGRDRNLQLLIAHGVDAKLEDSYGRNALFSASMNDSLLKALLDLPRIVVQDTDRFGLNILAYLQPEISMEALETILRSPINTNAQNAQIRCSVAENAAKWKQMPERVNLLLRHGFDIEAPLYQQSSFYLAAYTLQAAEFRRLVDEYHPPFDLQNPKYGPALVQACLRNGDLATLAFLLQHGLDINARDYRGASLLQFAYQEAAPQVRRDSLLRAMMAHNPKLDIADSLGQTILMQAMQKGDLPWAQYLVIHGADPNKVDRGGYPPLLHIGHPWKPNLAIAATSSNAALVKWLIRNGANPDKKAIDGNTLLMAACRSNDLALARYLIDTLHVALNDTNLGGESAFTKAVGDGPAIEIWEPERFEPAMPAGNWLERLPLVRYLISRGANVNARARYSYDPVVLLYSNGAKDLAQECITAGYQLNRRFAEWNLFQTAVLQNDHDFVKYLIKQGADPKVHFDAAEWQRYNITDAKMLEILRGK
jgi:ankyrin repeat protein